MLCSSAISLSAELRFFAVMVVVWIERVHNEKVVLCFAEEVPRSFLSVLLIGRDLDGARVAK